MNGTEIPETLIKLIEKWMDNKKTGIADQFYKR
jgi:hypothetical protein